ncbi:MAG: PpGpp-regulated growth inhibitor (ChpA/MazF) [Candidatus Nomurabacteria bacterium GW2011_GWA2_40_9]|uniref:PpGpp-regulated growth inhibitor (ChpA/MazF) n=1 Tax=Candidatus Nomurabacteria bacterium GW2011_GWA2_40_9 TaxID=1618734 RepID=A0A0G0TRR5_9BACT|nr:MAG: PpGpp-regulated growth inhibitor (ChpA/MazF) [Candidatus Nomurabacteria bacterium GW2011_GWA2_40_9]
MVNKKYIPDQGDIIYFNFSPSVGHEQRGVRPAIVVSRALFNQSSNLAVICPITSKRKFYPFEIPIETGDIHGVILIDQARAVDYVAREFKFISYAPTDLIEEVKAKFISIIS